MSTLIKNGRIIDPAHQIDFIGDMAIEQGKISEIGEIPSSSKFDEIIDASENWIIPGLVDICNRPSLKHPEGSTLFHEATVSTQKGITALCIPPDTDPLLDTASNLYRLKHQAKSIPSNLYWIGALTEELGGEQITDISEIIKAGSIAFSQAQSAPFSKQVLRSCYEYAATFDVPIIIQPQDHELSKKGCAHEGVVSTRLGLPGIPYTAETIAISDHLWLIEQTGIKAHFTCLSTYQAVEILAQAKQKGLSITADVAMHSLFLTEVDLMGFDANCHLYPPLRSQSDQLGLLQGLKDGTINAICSDHRPIDSMGKLAPFAQTLPGLSAIDSFLSLGIELINRDKLDLTTLIKALTINPANIFGLPDGHLGIGANANLCVVDPNQYWYLTHETMLSKGKNSPFLNWELPGVIKHTFFNGQKI